jgi:aminopeptidase N
MQSIALFSKLITPYPYSEIDFMPVDMKGAAGCEFPGLIYVGQSYYPGFEQTGSDVSLEFTVAHEVVHQWFYGLIGNDQYVHAFIDEGITNYLSADIYFEHEYDSGTADAIMQRYIQAPYDDALDSGVDPVVDTPTDSFDTGYDYQIAAYQKAPLGFRAIHDEIGNDAFLRGLQMYAANWTFRVATPDDMLAAFEAASGEDLDALWNHWFEEQHGDT